jgi:hypothetical protein
MKGLDGLAVLLFESDRDKRLGARRRPVIVPGEGEDDPPVRDDLAIDVRGLCNHLQEFSANGELRGGPGRTRTSNQTVMSGRL